jgi:hypothetical protein
MFDCHDDRVMNRLRNSVDELRLNRKYIHKRCKIRYKQRDRQDPHELDAGAVHLVPEDKVSGEERPDDRIYQPNQCSLQEILFEGLEEIAQYVALIFMQLHAAVNECCCRCPDRNDRKAAQKPDEIENPDLSELRYTSPYHIVYTEKFHRNTSSALNMPSTDIHRF